MQTFKPQSELHIGMIGAGVMGTSLAARIHELGYRLNIYERDADLRARAASTLAAEIACHDDLDALVGSLARPRCLLLIIKAGKPVDSLLDELIPLLDADDLVVDLGNSHYRDTERRIETAHASGLAYIGCGISGGAEGARTGAALMPGGDSSAWPAIQPLFEDIAARFDNRPCVDWIGPRGAGHFVKTVHNGIEYADMQLIAETYHLMRHGMAMSCAEIGDQFDIWNQGPLQSYLIEISARILRARDPSGTPVIDLILDRAGQKGTGSWASEAALVNGIPANMLAEAVFARMLSSFKDRRMRLARFRDPDLPQATAISLEDLEQALLAAKILAYSQGFELLDAASREHEWRLDLASIAASWRAGCIIRCRALDEIMQVFVNGYGDGITAAPPFDTRLSGLLPALRRVAAQAILAGMPIPGFSAALAYIDALQTAILPANLIQAQRDFFGAHGFQWVDPDRAEAGHFDWSKV